MSRILAIDYGKVRTGLAVSDPMRIIASALDTVETSSLFPYLEQYFATEKVGDVVIGIAIREHGETGEIENEIQKFIEKFKVKYPEIQLHRQNEAYTSIRASQAIFRSGTKKKKRREKGLIDRVAATIILQEFMG